MSDKAGTVYPAPVADSGGQPLEAGKIYRLTIPKDVPARQFWSLTMYDRATWAFVDNPLDRAGLGSFNKDQMNVNGDGSIDLYVGPKALADSGKTGYRRRAKMRACGFHFKVLRTRFG
ncbi:DUF1214 domain-containing protein [Bradyrhizobium sp. GCM10028915]|uniref:DUF1214 domain-containing protein n=1 Tax=unclassified Bradyrhizobium TaxID=2631580 RepID=UPI00361877D2